MWSKVASTLRKRSITAQSHYLIVTISWNCVDCLNSQRVTSIQKNYCNIGVQLEFEQAQKANPSVIQLTS